VAGQAISAFTDFMALFPNDPRVADAQRIIGQLNTVESEGNFKVAQYYEKHKQWLGALIYYNEARRKNPSSPLAKQALHRIELIQNRNPQPAQPAPSPQPAPPAPPK
jgi:outer membrane protein assembly factor BamD (BamD/ComL family)